MRVQIKMELTRYWEWGNIPKEVFGLQTDNFDYSEEAFDERLVELKLALNRRIEAELNDPMRT